MLDPNELEYVPEKISKLYRELQLRIMSDITDRVSEFQEISRAADWQISRLYELGVAKEVIKNHIKKTLKLTAEEVNKIYSDVLAEDYSRYEPIYKKLGKSFIPYRENKQLQQLISGIKTQTNGEFKNITGSLGFAVKNPDGTRSFQPIAKFYQKTLDNASMDILSGAFDYNTVLRRTVKEMTNSGLRSVDYASGWSNRIDVAARRAVMTGVNQVVAQISEENAEKLGTDKFEVTYHRGARPTHQTWQGRVYSSAELVSVCGYGKVDGLKGANCYHDFHPFIEGVSKRLYTDEELDRMNAEENTPKEYDGKQYTTYEALQRQRRLETTLRAKRQEINLIEKGGASENDILAAKVKYHATSNEYAKFSKAMGLPQERQRVNISPFKGVDVSFGKSAEIESKAVEKYRETDKQLTITKAKVTVNGIDVKEEYERNATPSEGKITFDEGFIRKRHKKEIQFADWLYKKYGGNIHLLKESTVQNKKTPDYIWNGKMWELKTKQSEKGADNAVREAYKQIAENPGGLFLDYGDNEISVELINQIIHKRAMRYKGLHMDVIVVNKGEVIEILRYKN